MSRPPVADIGSRSLLQRLIARGYQPSADADFSVRWVIAGECVTPAALDSSLARVAGNSFCVLCPTHVDRCDLSIHAAHIEQILRQLEAAKESFPQLALLLWIGMQWIPPASNEHLAVERLRALAARAKDVSSVPFIGMALPGPGKNRTINTAIHAASRLNPQAWVWIDDDIRMEEACLESLIARYFTQPARRALGARIISVRGRDASSVALCRIGNITAPRKAYPTAACMIVDSAVVSNGIPSRYFADDAFVLFELLKPSRQDPFEDLEVVPAARAYHVIGGGAKVISRQFRRRLYTHVIYSADYPWSVASCYLASCLLLGLWPMTDWDRSQRLRTRVLRWCIKATHLVLFALVATNLMLRGLVHRPLKTIPWGSGKEPDRG
jgi:hypothetical protein